MGYRSYRASIDVNKCNTSQVTLWKFFLVALDGLYSAHKAFQALQKQMILQIIKVSMFPCSLLLVQAKYAVKAEASGLFPHQLECLQLEAI